MQFKGDAPGISQYAFEGVTATAYFPGYNGSWTEDVLQDYGGAIFWLSYDAGDDPLGGREVIGRGNCGAEGDNLLWTLYEDGELVIEGNGEMADYVVGSSPWDDFRFEITKLSIADSVVAQGPTSIGDAAFANCVNLQEAVISDSVKVIGDEAFRFCSALTSFRIPNNLNRLGTAVFFGCYSLSSFTVGSNNRFQARDGVLFAATDGQRELVCYPAGKGGTYTIPSGVILIADYAFASGFVQKVTIPASVSEIGYGCFDECTRLTEIEVNSGNTLYKSVDGVLLTKDGRWLLRFPGGRSGDYTIDVSGKKTTNAVLWAYQNGITKGTSKKTFSPDAPCTRVQLVVFLYKYNAVYPVI